MTWTWLWKPSTLFNAESSTDGRGDQWDTGNSSNLGFWIHLPDVIWREQKLDEMPVMI